MVANSRSAVDMLPHVERRLGGLVLTGVTSLAQCRALRHVSPDLVLAVDHESHTLAYATETEAFGLRTSDGWRHLATDDLDEVLTGQLRNGASFAVTPTMFLGHTDGPPTLRNIMRQANRLRREDTVVLIACSYKWLQAPLLNELADRIGECPHPVALTLASNGDPLERQGVPEGLRQLCRTCPNVVLWRTDLAAFDALAHGALAGAIGITASLRHGAAPDRAGGGGGWRPFPVVLVGRLLRYLRVETLQDWFAHSDPWTCDCPVCAGAPLTRFTDTTASVLTARQHDVHALYNLHREAVASSPGHDRLEWWRQKLQDSYDLHRQLARQADMELSIPRVLQAWRRQTPLPLHSPRHDPSRAI
ncbi:hypothetical protein ACFXOY_09620 [Streptomyces niveus]|uniref:hypothetical protein n=1 Tax=Streptomyces niveus TaxID=193462 RepID=UPI003681E66F